MCYTNRLFFFSCVAVYINSALSFVPEVRNTVINLLLLGSKPKFRNFEEFLVHEEDDDQTGNFAVVVLFTNPYCGPCLKIKDELTTVNRKLKGRINLVAIDTDRYPSLGTRYNITDLPCTVLFKRGIEVHRIQGMQHSDEIIRQIEPFL